MAKVVSFAGIGCLLALLLGLPSFGHQQPWPSPESNDFSGFWNKLRDDAMIYQATIMYHQALGLMNKQHNCTYLSAPEEKVHVQIMKYLCYLEFTTFPAFNIYKVVVKSCEEYRGPPSPPAATPEEEPEKEEGTPYA